MPASSLEGRTRRLRGYHVSWYVGRYTQPDRPWYIVCDNENRMPVYHTRRRIVAQLRAAYFTLLDYLHLPIPV